MKKAKREYTETQIERIKAIQDTLKSMIFPLILLAIIGLGIWLIINYQNKEVEEKIIEVNAYAGDEAPVVLENDDLVFTMDPATTQFEVKVKSSGKVWRSNPEGAESDPAALTEEKNKLQSTLIMSYSITSGLETTYDSYSYSVKNGIYDIVKLDDNSIEVKYSLGKVKKEFKIPPVITKKNFDSWTGKMDKKNSELVKQYYKKYDVNKLKAKDDKKTLLENYPILETEVIYILRDTIKNDNVKKQIEGYFEEVGYSYEDWTRDKELDNSTQSEANLVFNINMIYRLDGKDLVVEIPMKDFENQDDYHIYTLTPLPYFGAGGKTDEGYMFVPEGGGSIINFNNGKISQNGYYSNVYGWDMDLSRRSVIHNTRAYYGVYGIAEGKDSVLCILEDGAPYAAIQADIAGRNNSYNYANTVYSISQREKFDVGSIANSDVYAYVENLPDENLVQRYSFIDSSSYVDMAKSYGEYLMAQNPGYITKNDDASAPVAIEIVGAVDKVEQILGVPVSRPLKLTTYKEAADMINELYSEGMTNMSVKMSGWCNGGVKQKMLSSARTISRLGSKKDLNNLTATAANLGVDLYLNGITDYEHDSDIFDGFFSYRDAAKFISKERAELYQYSAVTYAARPGAESFYLLHTDVASKMADNLVSAGKKYNAGVSFEDIGKDLSSDFYKKKTYSREAVKNLQSDKLKGIYDNGTNIMINMGNSYAIPYANMVTNMDLRGSEYTILDGCVPFYQLALHGYVNYTGAPINICGNTEEEILYSAEYGAGLMFTLMKESSFALQKTLYTEYYGSDYDAWHDRMLSIYTRYNNELGHTFNQEMTGHEIVSKHVSRTEYADGTKVYVNYGFTDADVEGVTVPSRDYLVIR